MCLDSAVLLPRLAGYANDFEQDIAYPIVSEVIGRPINNIGEYVEAINDPLSSARIFFKMHAFARAGGQDVYEDICIDLLKDGFQWKSGEEFYQAFAGLCRERKKGINKKVNYGVVSEGYKHHLNADVGWLYRLGSQISETMNVQAVFSSLDDIRGIGPKIAALVCRDLVWAFDIEDHIPTEQRTYMQPVDIWVWRVVKNLWSEFTHIPRDGTLTDRLRLKAGQKVVEELARLNISNVRFNQGAWYYCSRTMDVEELLRLRLLELQNDKSPV